MIEGICEVCGGGQDVYILIDGAYHARCLSHSLFAGATTDAGPPLTHLSVERRIGRLEGLQETQEARLARVEARLEAAIARLEGVQDG